MVPAGQRNRLFSLEEPSETVVNGDATIVYTERGTAWMKMEWLSGTDRSGLTSEATYRLTGSHRRDVAITPRWRLGLKGTTRKFEITGGPGDPDGRQRDMVITAKEIL